MRHCRGTIYRWNTILDNILHRYTYSTNTRCLHSPNVGAIPSIARLLNTGAKLPTQTRFKLVEIQNGTFYREHPSSTTHTGNPAYFRNLNFSILAKTSDDVNNPAYHPQSWAVIGASGNSTFLEVLRGGMFCDPPTARSYPYLTGEEIANKNPEHRIPSKAIQYVGFNSKSALGSGVQGAYLSARYESHREETDWTLLQYLTGDTELNPSEELSRKLKDDNALLLQVIQDLQLQKLVSMPVSNLSNGQTRRARIAKALLSKPQLLLLDDPFMGLDPPTLIKISPMLRRLVYGAGPLLVLALRPQDPVPDWISHVVVLGQEGKIALVGPREEQFRHMKSWGQQEETEWKRSMVKTHGTLPGGTGHILTDDGIRLWGDGEGKLASDEVSDTQPHLSVIKEDLKTASNTLAKPQGEPLIQVHNLALKYGAKTVLGHQPPGLNLTIFRGTRLALLGPNGSGKTTLLALFTSDHPQSYSLPVKFFGRDRLPSKGTPGLSLWEIQARIGHSSPEVHSFFPKHLSVRRALESAWAETFGSKPKLDDEKARRVDRVLRWWQPELRQYQNKAVSDITTNSSGESDLSWAIDGTTHAFRDLSFGAQRLLLLLRAIIKQPDILVLDEAFSGLSSDVRDKAMLFLEHGEQYVLEKGQKVKNPQAEEGMLQGLTDRQAMIVVSHIKEEIPPSVNEWLRLPSEEEAIEDGKDVTTGLVERDELRSLQGWNRIWGL